MKACRTVYTALLILDFVMPNIVARSLFDIPEYSFTRNSPISVFADRAGVI